MKLVITDSSALVALASKDDTTHDIAIKISEKIKERGWSLIIPGEVFTETVNLLGKKFGHKLAIEFGGEILRSDEYEIIDTDNETRQKAFEKFKLEANSTSFTDCIVMAFADHFETKDIFGFDEIFNKNGYKRLGLD